MGSIMKQNKLSYKIGQFLMFGGPATILFFAVVILPFFYCMVSRNVNASFISSVVKVSRMRIMS